MHLYLYIARLQVSMLCTYHNGYKLSTFYQDNDNAVGFRLRHNLYRRVVVQCLLLFKLEW